MSPTLAPLEPYRPVLVSALQDLARRFGKDVVVMITIDRAYGRMQFASYGIEAADKDEAAHLADFLATTCGMRPEEKESYEDFRATPEAEAAQKIEGLRLACRAADYLLASLLHCREGASDELITEVHRALQDALGGAA